MRRTVVALSVILAFVVGLVVARATAPSVAQAKSINPSVGYNLHIDAIGHFPGHANEVAHHWCKGVSNNITECLIFDSDTANARLVEVEMVVPASSWKTYPKSEQAWWHYHRVEIPRVHATLPDMTPAQAKKVAASLQETYGKVYMLWDPQTTAQPMGTPRVVKYLMTR